MKDLRVNTDNFSLTVYTDYDKGTQYRLTVNTFRDVEYLHLRKYYQDFEGEFQPTNEGSCIPLNIHSLVLLNAGISALLSSAEASEVDEAVRDVTQHIKEFINGCT